MNKKDRKATAAAIDAMDDVLLFLSENISHSCHLNPSLGCTSCDHIRLFRELSLVKNWHIDALKFDD